MAVQRLRSAAWLALNTGTAAAGAGLPGPCALCLMHKCKLVPPDNKRALMYKF